MNKVKTKKQITLGLLRKLSGVLVVAAAATLFGGGNTPAHAVNPIMHNSSTTQSKYWGGGWGNTQFSKYGQFTCTTCHTAGSPNGNVKGVRSSITLQGGPLGAGSVLFGSYTAFGSDNGHTSSNHVCDVCHTQTQHHRYDNSTNGPNHKGDVDCTACHLHSNGFKSGESPGGYSCDGCHSDLYMNGSGYGMHSNVAGVSYKHYLDNAQTTSDASLSGGQFGASWYATNVPNSTNASPTARRCLMCHVDHDQFKGNRAYNLRPNVTNVPDRGMNRDDNLCLSCHDTEKTKAVIGPNGETKVMPIPYPNLSYANATTVLNTSTHGYSVPSTYGDGTTFNVVCVKCHNDSIGRNGEGTKSSYSAQKGSYKFGEHNSTLPARFSIFGNDFYQRPASGTTLVLNQGALTVQVTPSPNWDADVFDGHYFVITNGTGANIRVVISSNTADTLTLSRWPAAIDNTSLFDIADDNLPIENVCFSCHSKTGEEKTSGANLDWYGQQYMPSSLEGIYDIFVGDSGILPASVRSTSVTVYLTKNTWNITAGDPNNIQGFRLWTPGGARTISTITAGPVASGNASYPYKYTLTVSSRLSSGAGAVQVVKPAAHPLDGFSRHESDERVTAGIGWNKGDTGVTVTANSATAATQITDTTKTWSGTEFNGLPITFPGLFDANGKWLSSTITGGGAGTVIFNPSVNGLQTAGGDNYFIGTRHVSCADCHNTHASFKNPEGNVDSATPTTLTDGTLINVNGWYDNIWVGRLIKVRSTSGYEQIRFVTAFSKGTGTYTVSIPWTTIPDNTYTYEVQMGDVWTSTGQSGGRAGSGSSGVWGLVPTGWRKAPAYGNMTGALGLRKIQNVFDNLSTTGLGGSTVAGQRDLCVRCHSSYAFGTATPMLPSGGPANPSNARGTDVTKEFNPNNPAHHAAYSRGHNQPIVANGDVAGPASTYNSYWPAFGAVAGAPYSRPNLGAANDTTKTVSVDTSGVVTFNANIPSTVRPGWMIYINGANGGAALSQGATKGWFEVATVDSQSQVTVRPKPNAAYSNSYFKLTAGLGNNFVPPMGPWAILRCTDCHGSTKTDPVGPHASVNRWLIKSLDTALSFDWFNGSSVVTITPNTGAVSTIFCFNCHRRDVYGDANSYNDSSAIATNKIAFRSFSRLAHSGLSGTSHPDGLTLTGFFTQDTRLTSTSLLQWKDASCRHCHVGDKIGGIHGTNAVASNTSAPNNLKGQGKRFLNGASWNGYNMPTTGSATCYTVSSNSVSNCGRSTYNTTTSKVLYNYTSAR